MARTHFKDALILDRLFTDELCTFINCDKFETNQTIYYNIE